MAKNGSGNGNGNGNGNGGGKIEGRPKGCSNIPKSAACKKCRKGNGMYCKNCTAA